MLREACLVAATAMLPFVELNGSIPLGVLLGLNPIATLLLSIIFNSLVFLPTILLMDIFYEKGLSKIKIVRKYVEKIRKRVCPKIKVGGYAALAVFIALPSPFTGVYTGAIASWLLGMERKKAFLAVFIGMIINGLIIFLGVMGIVKLFTIFA